MTARGIRQSIAQARAMGNEWAEIKDRDIRGRWCLIAVVFWPRFLVGVSADQDVISIGFGPVILDVYRKTDE